MQPPVEELEEKLGHRFRDRGLLLEALTHRSYLCEHPSPESARDNEQLEFLGDAVLGFIVSESLVLKQPEASEGQLSQWKAHLVSSNHLHRCALALRIGDHLLLGKGEERNGGRERKTLLANAFEAVIAAMYRDGGLEPARRLIESSVLQVLEDPGEIESIEQSNYKSVLQETTQAMGLPIPRYMIVETSGPEHAKVFTVEARVGDLAGRASGTSKKVASQLAAQRLIESLAIGAKDRSSQARP